ncbi:MAG: C4-dicarboxylate TRAP transporter large permease protein DctM [Paracidovorax wautersii]|uniref:C4-dicarboxylate TRAP transporter large permease protein DctM n=1 Tax=Paracidovorax wautersii TaxID=1177982 RepID=A0A7V8FKX4_9BURK|nr:MAG: C4-dicarboxylate TRAP transporter large permease protein DctM [Paracidovorax wautersii]
MNAVIDVQVPLATPAPGLARKFNDSVLFVIEHLAGAILAVDVLVVFASVFYRYALHTPLEWAEEVASGLMTAIIFLGAASVLGRNQHVGIDFFLRRFPASWRPALVQLGAWLTAFMCVGFMVATYELIIDSDGQTTPFGFQQVYLLYPVLLGALLMSAFALANAWRGQPRTRWLTLLACLAVAGANLAWNAAWPELAVPPIAYLVLSFFGCILIGVPIAFAIALASMLYFLFEPTLPMLIYSQQVVAGANHFVLLAIPFFVLAGLAMEANGMSARLIELLLRLFGRWRGGLSLITIISTTLFSGVSGSKLADVAAVGGIIVPAVRKTRQDPNDAAGLLACTAIMSETIPPCVNMIIFGFVASISIGGLFMAGVVPAIFLALCLSVVAVIFGRRIDPRDAIPSPRSLPRLIGGSLVALAMIVMIGKGVASGVATSTEISAFAVIYALLVGGAAFRELTWRKVVRLLVKSASMTGTILFIVAAASSLSYALTIERIPHAMATVLVDLGQHYGAITFVLLSALIMIVFGMVLEGAPALILFGPLLTPIATQLGVNPLQFGTVMVIAMGLGFFAPPLGLGLFATCAITGTQIQDVVRPMLKYLLVLLAGLLMLIFVPEFSLWLPRQLGLA